MTEFILWTLLLNWLFGPIMSIWLDCT